MLFIHIFATGFALAVIVMSDKEAFDWMRGKKQMLDPLLLHRLHLLTWTALLALIVSGLILFYPQRTILLTNPLFIMKLLFVAILCVNGILIGRLMGIAQMRPFVSLTSREKMQLLVSGAASFISWAGAFVLGMILFYF